MVAIVDLGYRTDHTVRLVRDASKLCVKETFDDMRRNPQPGQFRTKCAAQIVQNPMFDAGRHFRFVLAPSGNRAIARHARGKQQVRAVQPGQRFEDECHHFTVGEDVFYAVLGQPVGKGNGAVLLIYPRALQAGNFPAALAGRGEAFNNGPVGIALPFSRPPDLCNLPVV